MTSDKGGSFEGGRDNAWAVQKGNSPIMSNLENITKGLGQAHVKVNLSLMDYKKRYTDTMLHYAHVNIKDADAGLSPLPDS